ncbi:hypothetical protein [Marinimicrobium alkaliphilum]|uniref:hypothetical protein n=1 Tax=Marinimicrobium alkaliphilum TaxID=2202654 RepID=UPI000DBA68E5|nr:hypothetical protein [Marinimicrobium alkaliphilum]
MKIRYDSAFRNWAVFFWLVSLFSPAYASNLDGGLVGEVKVKEGEVYLSVHLTNGSDAAECIYYWPESKNVLGYSYNDFLLIVDSHGEIAEYGSMRADIDYERLNNSVIIIPPGYRVEASYNISSIYRLKSGQEYTAYYYLEAYACKAYDIGWIYPTSPDFLRSLAMEYDRSIDKIKVRVMKGDFPEKDFWKLYEMEAVEFTAP